MDPLEDDEEETADAFDAVGALPLDVAPLEPFDADELLSCVIVDDPGEFTLGVVDAPLAPFEMDDDDEEELLSWVIVEPPGEELGDDLVLVEALLVTVDVDALDVDLGVEEAVVPLDVVEVGDFVVLDDVALLAFSASSMPILGHRHR